MALHRQFVLAVQTFLNDHSVDELEEQLGVSARLSTDGRKFSLNYDQIVSKPGEIVDQCRGLILRPANSRVLADDESWKTKRFGGSTIVAYPFDRFYNYGDKSVQHEINLNDPNLRVEEKMDGTLIILYWDSVAEMWCVATRSVPDADLPISSGAVLHGELTFRTLFIRALENTTKHTFDQVTECLDRDATWMFELTSNVNKVVVKYAEEGVTLLGCRHVPSGKEKSRVEEHIKPVISNILSLFPRPERHQIESIDQIVQFVGSRGAQEAEGVVLVDSNWNRIKIKNPSYVLASKSRDMLLSSRRNMIQCILAEKIDDIMPYIDVDVIVEVEKCRQKLVALFDDMDTAYTIWRAQVSTRKDFAGLVALSKYDNKPFFELWEKKYTTTREHYKRLAKSDKISARALDHLDHMSKDL